MTMCRIQKAEGWEQRLADYVESRRGVEFEWGRHDCCVFTAGAIEAMTGADFTSAHQRYSTALGAARVIRDAGGISALPGRHGLHQIEPLSCAGRGDVVLVEIDGRESLGVCLGADSFFASAIGIATIKTAACVAAWRVE